jgi:hypothetical protein
MEFWAAVVAISVPFGAATTTTTVVAAVSKVSSFVSLLSFLTISILYSLIVVSGALIWLLTLAPYFASLSSRAAGFACRPFPLLLDEDDTTETFRFIRLPFLALAVPFTRVFPVAAVD